MTLNEIIAAFRGPQLTPEQVEARSKANVITTFCFILAVVAVALVYSVVRVEQPMLDMAPADKFNYEILKIMAVQIFSVLAILLGAKAMTPSTPPAPSTDNDNDTKVTQTVILKTEDDEDVRPAA